MSNKLIEDIDPRLMEQVGLNEPVNKRLDQYRTLELNADYQPLSYFPLSTQPWHEIMRWIGKGEQIGRRIIDVVEVYRDENGDPITVQTGGGRAIPLPAVVAHTEFIPLQEKIAFTRFNILLRDDFTCQYTGVKYSSRELNLDHVIPKSRGGKTSWDNIVAAHIGVNTLKADRTPKEAGLKLLKPPRMPSPYEMREKGKKYPPNYLHETWMDYLYWDAELDTQD